MFRNALASSALTHRHAQASVIASPCANQPSAKPALITPASTKRASTHARRIDGFSLIELMLALLVVGLVFSFAIPALTDFVSGSRATAARARLSASLFDAMREAAITGRPVVVCPDGGGVCAGGTDWSRGWIVFIDRDGNRHRGPGEPLIGQHPELPDDVHLIGSAGRQKIVYSRNGSSVGSNTTFTLCDRRGPLKAQQLVLSNGGRLRAIGADPVAAGTCAAGLP